MLMTAERTQVRQANPTKAKTSEMLAPPFRPTAAPSGRLARLGVVLDTRNNVPRLREIARMCERAGIDALWVDDEWDTTARAGAETSRVRVGAQLSASPPELAAMAGALNATTGGRLELTLPSEDVAAMREHEDIATVPLSVVVATLADIGAGVLIADDLLIPAAPADEVVALAAQIRVACEAAGRPIHTLGISLEVPVSIGRTDAEARARADTETLFAAGGHPELVGMFGTLERCQERVIRLAHAGITDLRCRLPNTPDVHDVIAQLTAMVVGSTDVLAPDAPRSPDPEPPQGWGGRR
jgi:alkanesulfonate monooxygenase SsuD/methylene tetrahydromethanopterin reductase-like flavin-dependent oxidoreductase (luciferase family)